MRITNNMMVDTTLSNLNANQERLDKLQNQLTSGQRINAPSDDPIGVAQALEFRNTISQTDQYLKNVDAANSWLGAADSALGSVTDTLDRARELAVQGASDTLSASDRQAIATEVSDLLEQAVTLGNSTYSGQYIFSGVKVGTSPFATVGNPPTSVTYNGDSGSIARQINNQASLVVSTPGDTTFTPVFTALINLRDGLNNGDSTAVSNSISDIDAALDTVTAARSQVGARINRLTDEQNRLQSLKVDVTGLLSKVQDTDMTQAISDYSLQQTVYQAALAAGAKAIQPSLLDYLK